MTNRHVHHQISTKLDCAPPKCMLVHNYIVNLDLYVCHEPLWLFSASLPLCTMDKKCLFPVCSICTIKIKDAGGNPYFKNRSPLCTMVHNAGQRCTMQVNGAQRSNVPMNWCTMQLPQMQKAKRGRQACLWWTDRLPNVAQEPVHYVYTPLHFLKLNISDGHT